MGNLVYFKEDTLFNAINSLKKISYSKGKSSNIDLLSFYLILKRLGISENKWITKIDLYANKEKTLSAIYDLGGLFDNDEDAELRGCLFFTSFSLSDKLTPKEFFNQGTKFQLLPSRLKDTIDNSIADHILDKGMGDSYRLSNNCLNVIKSNYIQKIPIESLLVWVYRHVDIKNLSIDKLRALFFHTYNLSIDEAKEIFDFKTQNSIYFQNESTKASSIRAFLNAQNYVEFTTKKNNYNFLIELDYSHVNKIFLNMNITKEKIIDLLNTHKQIIITGVPGTGKSYLINQISDQYDIVKKIQFHQNYTYQQFVFGKTIREGNVEPEEGELIKFLNHIKGGTGKKYLLFLDEINRGNISSIFGEVLYALDRGNEIILENNIKLSFPDNLHIIGTMNSADRSIALIDFAIRRRFIFLELKPDYSVLNTLAKLDGKEILGDFLKKINDNIFKYFESEDYLLGHSYFLVGTPNSIEIVYDVLHYKIIPIIIEYAHGDRKSLSKIFSQEILEASQDELIEKINDFINA
jgi:5-methylcytosine-specific restriction protein B